MAEHNFTKEEVARRGQQIYDERIRQDVEADYPGKFLAVDILTGNYEIADDLLTAGDRVRARNPSAVPYTVRVGSPFAIRLGSRWLRPAS